MHAASAPLFDALARRGDAPFLAWGDRAVPAAAYREALDYARARAAELPLDLEPGAVVAIRGRHPALRVFAPLAAWSLGLCALPVGDREPDAAVDALLAAAGARGLVGWRPPGVFESVARTPARDVRLAPGALLATSGTASRPKLVAHDLEALLASAQGAVEFLEMEAEDRVLLSLPTHHAGGLGMVLRTILAGAVLCVPGRDESLAQALVRVAPTQVSLVATQLDRLLREDATTAALRACRTVLLGGGPLAPGLRARALAAGVPLAVSYGATETAALVAASDDPEVVRRAHSAGRPLPQRDVRVDGDGAIRVGGPTLFAGYLVDGRLEPARDGDGLWVTGDVGRLEDGVLYVTGRRDRMFVSGGENVHPEEIEAALLEVPGVAAAVVVSRADAEFGRRPVAFVEGADIDGTTLDAQLRAVLPGFKTPDAYYRMPPQGGRMKPDVPALAALAAAGGPDLQSL